MKKCNLIDNKYYFVVNKHYNVMELAGAVLKYTNIDCDNVYDNIEDARNKLLQNLNEYVLIETYTENKNIALYNINCLKEKILDPEKLAIFKLFKGQK